MGPPNQDKITTLGEKITYKYSGILEADTIKHVKLKEEIKNMSGEIENYLRQNYLEETFSKE